MLSTGRVAGSAAKLAAKQIVGAGALRKLQLGSEPVSYETISRQIESAVGRPRDQIFERFDHTPIAAASIGQVHRARAAGREVAVKVQYPGMRETMVADISRFRKPRSI